MQSCCEVVAKLEEIKGKFPLFEKEVEQLAVEFVHLAGIGVDVYCRDARAVTIDLSTQNAEYGKYYLLTCPSSTQTTQGSVTFEQFLAGTL